MDEQYYADLIPEHQTVADVLKLDVSEEMKTALSKHPLNWIVLILEKSDGYGIGVISPENYNSHIEKLDNKNIPNWFPKL
jgi:hypothetical protein